MTIRERTYAHVYADVKRLKNNGIVLCKYLSKYELFMYCKKYSNSKQKLSQNVILK